MNGVCKERMKCEEKLAEKLRKASECVMLQKKEKRNSKIIERQQKYMRKKFNKEEYRNMECIGKKNFWTKRKEQEKKN